MLNSKQAQDLLNLLKKEVVPALGCTEPIAVALAVAKAREAMGTLPDKIQIYTSLNIYKNGMGVGIPGTDMVGLPIAAALGAIAGHSSKELEVLAGIQPSHVQKATQYLNSGAIDIQIKRDCNKLYVEVICSKGSDKSRSIIEGSHQNFVHVSLNDQILFEKSCDSSQDQDKEDAYAVTINDIYEFATTQPIADIRYILDEAMVNKTLSDYGISHPCGMGIGAKLLSWISRNKLTDDFSNYAMAITAAASDARMSGALLPAMSNSGSGNQGITAMMPVLAVAEKLGSNEETLIRALILSNLCAIHIKHGFGRLSAACGCVVASTGAACGVCFLLGGNLQQIIYAIKNMIGNLTGMVCDGAKLGCALKVASGTSAAIQSAILAIENVYVPGSNGIIEEDIERTISNIGYIANKAMNQADEVILDIMLHKQKQA
ncbi:MAG: L-serine ammonia-lyase, iron-sulfur-dependent, subunit alpha [Bacteroidales bacterium]